MLPELDNITPAKVQDSDAYQYGWNNGFRAASLMTNAIWLVVLFLYEWLS